MKYENVCISLKESNKRYLDNLSKETGIPKSVIIQKVLDGLENLNIDKCKFLNLCG